jgi:hypothetical protein
MFSALGISSLCLPILQIVATVSLAFHLGQANDCNIASCGASNPSNAKGLNQ